MRVLQTVCLGMLLSAALLLSGCPLDNYPTLAGEPNANITAIDRIRNNTNLTPQQQRQQLADLGFDAVTINALLSSVRLANQYGGDLRTAYTKVTSNQFNRMTPDEVQIYGDEATAVDPNGTLQISLTDPQAQAIVNLFTSANIQNKSDLSAYLADPANVIPSTIPANTLKPLFIDFDPQKLLPKLP